MPSKPFPRFGVQVIGKVGQPRPYRAGKGCAVFFGAEVTVCNAFFGGFVPFQYLDAGVDDRHQTDALLFTEIGCQLSQVGESIGIDGKVLVVDHIVDVQIDHVQRDSVFMVSPGDLTDIRVGKVIKP